MTPLISPCCLHWALDGELAPSDRQDLLQSLHLEDNRGAGLRYTQALTWSDLPGRSGMSQPFLQLP